MADKQLTDMDSERLRIRMALNQMQGTFDSRMLLFACLARAAGISELLIAAGVAKPEDVTEWFAQACADAMTPRERTEPVSIGRPACEGGESGNGKPN